MVFGIAVVAGCRRRTFVRVVKYDINLGPGNISLTSLFEQQTYVVFKRPLHPFLAAVRAFISPVHRGRVPRYRCTGSGYLLLSLLARPGTPPPRTLFVPSLVPPQCDTIGTWEAQLKVAQSFNGVW